jgi:hypothetical protein
LRSPACPHRLCLFSLCLFSLGLALLALSLPATAQVAGTVLIVGGASDAVKVKVKDRDKPDDYYRTSPSSEHLLITAEGPVTLSVRFRAASPGRCNGTLRVLRDDGPFSDNPYDLAHDGSATPDASAAIEGGAVTTERVLYLKVAEGEHRFMFSAVRGPALLIRVFRTAKYDPALAVAPEKNTNVDTTPAPPKPAPSQPPAPKPAVSQPPAPKPAQPAPDPLAESAPATPDAAPATPAPREVANDWEAIPEKPIIPLDPNAHHGFALGLHAGGLGFLGFTKDGSRSTGPLKLSHRLWTGVPVALELAWDINGLFSLFVEGSYLQASRLQTVRVVDGDNSRQAAVQSAYRAAPLLGGLTLFVPLASRVGLRFRLGAGIAYVESRSAPLNDPTLPDPVFQAVWAVAGTGGVGVEALVGPGRFTLECRYMLIHTDAGLQTVLSASGVNAIPGDLGGLQVLAGYRFEL